MIPLFRKDAIHAEPVIWNDSQNEWSKFDAIIIRSTWDYHLNYTEFIRWLDLLLQLKIPVLNPIDVLKKNAHKFYLQELSSAGIITVPTLYLKQNEALDFKKLERLGWKKAVIKPAVAASSYLTVSFDLSDFSNIKKEYQSILKKRDLLIQQFLPEILDQGEYSIFFFNRTYSHTVLKTAMDGEFRVQSDYGGLAKSIEVNQQIIDQARTVLSHFEGPILQARVDGVVRGNKFILMEIELIEPELFFDLDQNALSLYVQSAVSILRKYCG